MRNICSATKTQPPWISGVKPQFFRRKKTVFRNQNKDKIPDLLKNSGTSDFCKLLCQKLPNWCLWKCIGYLCISRVFLDNTHSVMKWKQFVYYLYLYKKWKINGKVRPQNFSQTLLGIMCSILWNPSPNANTLCTFLWQLIFVSSITYEVRPWINLVQNFLQLFPHVKAVVCLISQSEIYVALHFKIF